MTKQQMVEMGFRLVQAALPRAHILYAVDDPQNVGTRTLIMIQRGGIRETMLVEAPFPRIMTAMENCGPGGTLQIQMWVHHSISTVQPRGVHVPGGPAAQA